jgi:tellurite resistance protein
MPRILRLPFALSFWALSFPLAAVTISSFLYAEKAASGAHKVLGTALLALLVVTILALVARTLTAIRRREVCLPE